MYSFSDKILHNIQSWWLIFPGFDTQAVLNQILPIAEEWIMMKVIANHLPSDDQALFRDAYLSAPDIFDPVEFLNEILPDLDILVDQYFDLWLIEFNKKL